MPYRVEKFKMEHFRNFDSREEQKAEVKFLYDHKAFQDAWIGILPVFTLFYNEKPIMIYGMQNSLMGTYYPMAYAGKGIDKHRFAVIRCLYDYVDKFVDYDVRRFEAYVSVTDKKAQRLAEFFGMEIIGYRRQASASGEDQVIYERLWRKS